MKFIKHFFFALFMCVPALSWAQSLPDMPAELQGKTITMIVPWNPGGDSDAIQRFVAEQVTKLTGLRIVVINRAGAKGIIGARELVAAKADGLTIMGSSNETFVINPVLEDQAVDIKKLQPVAIYAFTPQFLYTGANSEIRSVKDIVRVAKNNPKFTVGCNIMHQCMYMSQLLDHFGIKPYTVMFKTPGDMAIAATNGDIHIFGAGAASGAPFVQGGRIRAVATTWDTKLSVYPDADPLAQVIPGFRANNLQMLSVPAGTPKRIVDFYNQVFRAALKTPESVKKFSELSLVTVDLTVDQVERALEQELQNMQRLKRFAIVP